MEIAPEQIENQPVENETISLSFGAEELLSVIRNNPGQGRAALLSLSGIQPVNWLPAINSLLANSLIRREGERKGARYFAV